MKSTLVFRSCLIFLAFGFVISCCTSKVIKEQELPTKESSKMEINTFKVISQSRVKDIDKLMDTPYLYDLEVEKNTSQIDSLIVKELRVLIANDSSFLDHKAIPQCKPNPEFFIQLDSSSIYGFHLDSICPTVLLLEFIESETITSLKYLDVERVNVFVESTNKFFEQ